MAALTKEQPRPDEKSNINTAVKQAEYTKVWKNGGYTKQHNYEGKQPQLPPSLPKHRRPETKDNKKRQCLNNKERLMAKEDTEQKNQETPPQFEQDKVPLMKYDKKM